jgi:hypothetical protein
VSFRDWVGVHQGVRTRSAGAIVWRNFSSSRSIWPFVSLINTGSSSDPSMLGNSWLGIAESLGRNEIDRRLM